MGKNKPRCLASCQCGQTAVEVIGAPIVSAVCYCGNCQAAGHAFERADGAPRTVGTDGGTEYCLYRKDRATVIRGGEYLQEHRLTPDSKTRRVVATCCNAPMFPVPDKIAMQNVNSLRRVVRVLTPVSPSGHTV